MISSLNSLGGLSAAELLKLFGANSSSSSSASNSASASQAQSAPIGVSGTSTGDPANAIKAILAQAQISQSQTAALGGGGWTLSVSAEAAYADQAGGSSSLLSANVTISSPGALQQINDAVSEVNKVRIYAQSGNVSSPITATAADAVNVTIGNGGVTLTTTTQGSGLLSELPSQASIQQAYNDIMAEDKFTGYNGMYNGNFTLVKLPSNALGANGGNIKTFGTGNDKWELVLSQDAVSATVSDTQIKG